MMTFHASSYHWTLALVLMTLTFIDGEEALNPHLQSHIEKRIFCNTYSGCRSSVPIVKTTSKRQHPLRLYDGLESLVESERDYDEVAPLLVQDVDSRQTSMADTPSLEDRSLPPLVTWLQNRRKIENESEVPTEDAEERFWRIILAALTSTINRPLNYK